jgi:hypothetical protein
VSHAQFFVQWQAGLGGTNYDECTSLHVTDDGGCVVAGGSESGATGNKTSPNYGDADYWLVKLDAEGNWQWDKSYGGSGLEYANGVEPTADGGWLLGGQSGSGISGNKVSTNFGIRDYWLVKTDANGNKEWEMSHGGTNTDVAWCLKSVRNSYLLAGNSLSGISGNKTNSNYGGMDWWLVSVDANGNKQWEAEFGGSSWDYLYDVEPASDSGFLMAGETYSGISGNKNTPNYGFYDAWVVKCDSNGHKLWDKTFGGDSDDYFEFVLPVAGGGCLVGGHSWSGASGNKASPSLGEADWWLLLLDENGNKQWEKVYGGDDADFLKAALPYQDGYLLFGTSWSGATGNKTTANFGDSDYWLVMVDSSGNKQWGQSFGGVGEEYAVNALKPTPDGGWLLGGYSLSGATGNKTVGGFGDFDFWVIKLVSAPTLSIAPIGLGQAEISWTPDIAEFGLQEATSLTSGAWTNSPSGSTNPIVVPVTGNSKFYRLTPPS